MSKHYTFVDMIGNRVFHRYWDGKEAKQQVTDEFPIDLYIKGRDADSTSIYGDKLSKISFSEVGDAREFMKEHGDVLEIFGQTSFAHQFISATYPGELTFDIENFKIVYLDIETAYGDDGFPTPAKAAYPILAITCKLAGQPGFHTWGVKAYKPENPEDIYYQHETEELMLASFLGWWNRERPDILSGWNCVGFDVPYLVNRLTKVLGETQAAKLSPFHQNTSKVFSEHEIQGDQTSYRILGITIFDYIELYKKFNFTTQESYRLDAIANYELDEAKIDYSDEYSGLMDLYNRNPQLYYKYNVHDVRLVESLDKKLNYLFLAITIAYIGKVRMHEIFSQVKFWDTHIYNVLRDSNIQIPPHIEQGEVSGIAGAYVKDPIPGLYEWLASFDLTSLYPSILIALNMSPETLVDEAIEEDILEKMIALEFDTSSYHKNNLAVAANGSTYRRDIQGVMPEITADMFKNRKKYKGMMLDVQKDIQSIKAEMKKRGLNEH